MASENWTELLDVLESPVVARGATAGIARPNGGGTYCYGMNSLALTAGVVALHANQSGFAPADSGGSIRGAIQRGVSAGEENFAPFFFIGLQGQNSTDVAYMLGLGDADPHHIVLRKGALTGGLPDQVPDPDGEDGILMRSTASYVPGTWLHLRLDVIVQGTGDVLLQCYANDLNAHTVSSPTWVLIPGMEGPQYPTVTGFVDDNLQENTNSPPLVTGRMGFGMWTADIHRRSHFDHIVIGKQ